MSADHVKAVVSTIHNKMIPGLYRVVIKRRDGSTLADVPIEAEFFTSRTHAGHILRGYAVQEDDFSLRCDLINSEGQIVGQAAVKFQGATMRGANITTFVRTAEQKAEHKATMPKINKVEWF